MGSALTRWGQRSTFIYVMCVSLGRSSAPWVLCVLFWSVRSETMVGIYLPFCLQMGSPETPKLGTRTLL